MSRAGIWLRRAAFGLLLGVLTLAALTARVIAEGQTALDKSNAAFDRGDLRESILYARRAAVLYVPGAPHVVSAYARLKAIAEGAEASGNVAVAREAWGAVRAAALETRHFETPRADDLARANANLARLSAAGDGAARSRAGRLLARDEAPRAPWVLAMAAGFALFSCGLGLAATRGVSPTGRISLRGLAVSGFVALAGVACFTWAVYRA